MCHRCTDVSYVVFPLDISFTLTALEEVMGAFNNMRLVLLDGWLNCKTDGNLHRQMSVYCEFL